MRAAISSDCDVSEIERFNVRWTFRQAWEAVSNHGGLHEAEDRLSHVLMPRSMNPIRAAPGRPIRTWGGMSRPPHDFSTDL